ncbi:MAG: GntR family transcriptional regulator [Clostridiales bacterium]|nr:GntR family transcriptional regulator [Clostridiales bacterium]
MLINTGVYKPEDRLPSIRNLASELNINVNTIKRAFAELDKDGVTYSAPGRGIFVSSNPIGNEKVKKSALEDIKTVVISGKARGVTEDDLNELIKTIYGAGDKND